MFEIVKNIYVGSEDDYLNYAAGQSDFSVIHAKGEPYYSMGLLEIGNRQSPLKGYKYLYYQGSLCLNYSMYDDSVFIVDEMFEECVKYIDRSLEQGQKVLVHCGEGICRSPSIVFYYLIRKHALGSTFDEASLNFFKLYPSFTPTSTMVLFLKQTFEKYSDKSH